MNESSGVQVLYCEFLSVRVLFSSLLPALIRARRRVTDVFYIDATRSSRALLPLVSWMSGAAITQLAFRLADVRDGEGQLIRLRVAYQDLQVVRDAVAVDPRFQAFAEAAGLDDDRREYLGKCVCSMGLTDHATMWRTLLVAQVAAWHASAFKPRADVVLLLERRPWQAVVEEYVRGLGVSLTSVPPRVIAADRIREWLGPRRIFGLRRWRDVALHLWTLHRHGVPLSDARRAAMGADLPISGGPRVVVEYLGHLELQQPEYYSDVFFWQASALRGEDLVVTFGVPHVPLTGTDRSRLRQAGITPVAVYPGATTASDVPLFTTAASQVRRALPAAHSLEQRWLREQLEFYDATEAYWRDFCDATRAKVFVAWNRFDQRMYPIAAALRSRDGSTAIYQRSFQIDPAPESAVHAELVFGFSPRDAVVEGASGSRVDYHVAVGYTADHRAPYWRPHANAIRSRLRSAGAERIVAYFDENSGNDSRWHTGHEFMRVNYEFILERLLNDPTLGLVLKPKRPSTLRSRLGPLAPLLERALESGRCYIYETGVLHGSEPPVAGALSADLVIHGHLCASTAGLEAALAGVPTLLLDREGWPKSEMFKLGPRVAFSDWSDLWSAVEEHWRTAGGVPGFGDWRPFIEELDPFRDGRAAERVGTYLDWVISGYKAGRTREVILADAAERYAAQWGSDKISRVVPASTVVSQGAMNRNERHYEHAS